MGPNMQLYPSAPFIVQPPPLVPCSGSVGGAFSFAMPAPVGHFVPQVAHLPGFCPSGQYQCCVRLPPPVIEGRDYYVNGVRPGGQTTKKEEVETKLPSKTKSQSTLTPAKESSKSKANKYKYSILYNGPIYKGPTSSPQQSVTNTPPVESFVPTTESDNAGNVKLSLPAVLTSTGVLQITVPSLRSIEPKQTTNPSAFPQIKLQTVHGAVLTPGVLPTVLSPQHHPNSGHVVVVSAAQNQANRTFPARVSLPSAAVIAPNNVSTVSRTTASISAIVVSSNSRSASSIIGGSSSALLPGQTAITSSISSSPTVLSSSTSTATSTAGSHNQSLHSILGQVQNTDTTKSSITPTTTVPLLVSARSIISTGHAASVVTVSHTDSPKVSSRMTTSVQETNRVRQRASDTSHPPVTTSQLQSPAVAADLQNSVASRTSPISVASQPSNGNSVVAAEIVPERNSAESSHTAVSNNVNRLPTADTNVNSSNHTIHAAPTSVANHTNPAASGQVDVRTPNPDKPNQQPGTVSVTNPASDVRWPSHPVNHPVNPSNRLVPELSNSRNREDNSRLPVSQNQVNRTEANQITPTPTIVTTTPSVTTSMSHTISTSLVSTPRSNPVHAARTMSQQHGTMPRLMSTDGSSRRGGVPSDQRQPTMVPTGRMNISPPSGDVNPGMVQRNNIGTGSHNNNGSGHSISSSGSNAGDLNQSRSSGLVQQQRNQEDRPIIASDMSHRLPTPDVGVRRPHQIIDAASGPRSARGSFQSDQAASSSHHQIFDSSRSNSNGKKAMSSVINDSTSSNVRKNLMGDSNRSDSVASARRPTDVSSHGKQQNHLQQFSQTLSNRMPRHNIPSTSQVNSDEQFSPMSTTSTAPDAPLMNRQPQTFSSTGMERQAEDSQGPPVVCVTPGNEFVRPASSTHRWPQMGMASASHSQIRPTASLTTASATQGSYTEAVQSVTRNYASNPSNNNNNTQMRQQHPNKDRSAPVIPISISRAFPTENRNSSSSQNYNAMQGPKSTSRPWQSSSENASGISTAYGGLGLRGRSSSAGHLNDSQTYMGSNIESQTMDRFRPPSSVSSISGSNVDKEAGPHVQSVPLFSNVPANTRQAMNDVINRRVSRTSRPQPNRPPSDILQGASPSSSSSHSTGLHSEPDDSHHRSRFDSSLMSPERSQASASHLHSATDHVGHTSGGSSGILHSDPISRFPMPIVHPMLYGNSPSVPNLPGMSSLHGVPHLAGGLGSHRHGVRPPHPLTPPPAPAHHTPPRPTPHGHNHMFVPPPYASMHRPLYMPATSPRPPDLGLVSPRTYSHVHDSGLYSPRFQSMQSSSNLAENILNSHLARTFSDDRLDTCCSGLHAHSPPAPPSNSRHVLPHGFSSPPAPSLGSHPLPLPPSSTPSGNLPQHCSSSFQGTSHTALPSDIFGPSHLESIAPSMISQTATTRTSNIATCASSIPSVPTPLTVQTNLNPHVTNPRSASSSSSNVPSEGANSATPTGSSHNSPPTCTSSPLPARVFVGNTSDKYLPLEEAPPTPGSGNGITASNTAALNSDQIVKFGDIVLESSRQILRESGRTVLCCWHCDYHTAEPKKMYRHQKKDTKEMKCQLCDFKGFSRCTVNQHFKEKHMDKM